MALQRHVEIAGAGFAGLTAACALAQRGWSVRVHERSDVLRTTGAGIYIYENGLRVLEAVGAYDAATRGANIAHTREMRDGANNILSVHKWKGSRVFSVVRQNVINALADAARKAGAEIVTGSVTASATPDGELRMADGTKHKADLVIAADGTNSKIRDNLDLLASRKYMVDGCIRVLIPTNDAEKRNAGECSTVEYWSESRRILYTPCSETELYVAFTMLDSDVRGKQTPIDRDFWCASFPLLEPLIDRIGDNGRYDRFELTKLKQWSAGKVAVIGDAAHALPPNIGQGGGCAMMNALSMAVHLDRTTDIPQGLKDWERAERPLTDHTQRASVLFGMPTTWPKPLRHAFFNIAGRSQWLIDYRTRTARHRPTGT